MVVCRRGIPCHNTCINENYTCRPRGAARGPRGARVPRGARAPRGGGEPDCRKGKLCHNTCINKNYRCRPRGGGRGVPPPADEPPVAPPPPRAAPPRAAPPPAAPHRRDTCRGRMHHLRTLPNNSSFATVRRAYHRGALKCHPDKGGSVLDMQCLGWERDRWYHQIDSDTYDPAGCKPVGCR